MSELTWDGVDVKSEEVSEQDIKNAESSGRPPVGKYIMEVVSSKPKQVNPKGKESYFVASLKLKIEEVLEIEGKKVNGKEGDQYLGRFMFDDISLARQGEADAVKNRRIFIAKRAGIITDSSSNIPSNTWSDLIIGKRFMITTEVNEYIPEGKTQPVKNVRVAMFGYDYPEKAEAVSDAELADI